MFVVEEMLTSAAWMLVVFRILSGLAHRWSEGEPRDANRRHHIPQGTAGKHGVEGIAGYQGELILPLGQCDRCGPRIDDLTALHYVSLRPVVNRFDHDLVLLPQPPQETKMGVSMTCQDRRAW